MNMRNLKDFRKEFKLGILLFGLIVSPGFFITAQHISIRGNEFFVDSSSRIWLNGVNTPWYHWKDFGKNFDCAWWNNHFRILKSSGINSTRIWFSCNGDGAVKTDASGVTGLSSTFFQDCDALFAIAESCGIYIDATMISFDHFKQPNANHMNWRNIVTSAAASQTFIDHYLLPFVNRYKSNPYLFAIDLC